MTELQRTDEWHAARLGKLTASRIADATARTKNGWGASRANYMAELVLERLTGQPTQGYVNRAMLDGIEREPEAKAAYTFMTGNEIVETGFVPHPSIAMAGASPDGLIGDHGLIEIKCPTPATHIAMLMGGQIDSAYIKQMQFQMACTGRIWVDFVSYHPHFPPSMRLYMSRVERNERIIEELEHDAVAFLRELESCLNRLRRDYRCLEAA